MIKNTPALGVCPPILCFLRNSRFPFKREIRRDQACLVWRLFAPEPTWFSQNLEFGVGNSRVSLSWSLELGTCKPYSCEVFEGIKNQWKPIPLKGSMNQRGRTTWLQRERKQNRWCLKVFVLLLLLLLLISSWLCFCLWIQELCPGVLTFPPVGFSASQLPVSDMA